MRNFDGVIGDARKRLEESDAVPFDRHPECLLCGRRDYHTHVGLEDHVTKLFAVPRD